MTSEGRYEIKASCAGKTDFIADYDFLGEKAYDAIMYTDGTEILGQIVS